MLLKNTILDRQLSESNTTTGRGIVLVSVKNISTADYVIRSSCLGLALYVQLSTSGYGGWICVSGVCLWESNADMYELKGRSCSYTCRRTTTYNNL